MKRFLSSILGSLKSAKSSAKPSFRPALEALEDRFCPSCVLTTADAGHTLQITGDAAANVVTLRQNDNADSLQVICDGVTSSFSSSAITKVVINLKGGADQLSYQLSNGSDFEKTKEIIANLGAGHDKADFDFFNDGNGGQSDIEANLSLTVNGGLGNDILNAQFGKVEDVNLTVHANLGYNADTAAVKLKGDLEDDAKVLISLQDTNSWYYNNLLIFSGGTDKLSVDASSDVDIDDNASLEVTINGYDRIDTLDFKYQGELDGLLKLRMNGGAGGDVVKALVTLDDTSDGDFDGEVRGGGGNDVVTFQLFNNAGNDVSIIQALLNGGTGFDTCVKTPNVTSINCEA